MIRSFIAFGRWAPARPSTKRFVFFVETNFRTEKKNRRKIFGRKKIGRKNFGRQIFDEKNLDENVMDEKISGARSAWLMIREHQPKKKNKKTNYNNEDGSSSMAMDLRR